MDELPAADPKHKDDPYYFLLSESDERLTASQTENFVRYVVEARNQAGLQAAGTVVIPWNPDHTKLTINRIAILRGGQSIDAYRSADLKIIQREEKLDQATITGTKSVVLPIQGLEVGDRLDVGFTYETRAEKLGKSEEVQPMVFPIAMGKVVRRFHIDPTLSARWRISPELAAWEASTNDGTGIRTFTKSLLEPAKKRDFMPPRYKTPIIQVSAYTDWNDVAAQFIDRFQAARKVSDTSNVAALAATIAAKSADPQVRMLAALRAVQDQVRYTALVLGSGDYTPDNAEDVWNHRYGDCKGKTALLLALLDRLGIQADAVLASVENDDLLSGGLPTLALLDHVYVRAELGSTPYYLDGTQFGQRSLDELRVGSTRNIVPIAPNSNLVAIPDVLPARPMYESTVVYDARNALTKNVPFEASIVFRGSAATDMRQAATQEVDRDKILKKYRDRVIGVPNDNLEWVSTEPDGPNGDFTVKFKGKVDMDWSPVDGLRGNRFQFSQSTVKWNVDFDRNEKETLEIPVYLGSPNWERSVETIILPGDGRDFAIDAQPIDKLIAGSRATRTVTQTGNRIIATSDFKILQREVSATTANGAKSTIDGINENYAYAVAKRKLPPSN